MVKLFLKSSFFLYHTYLISGLGGVALTRYMDGRTDGRTGRFLYTPQTLFVGGMGIKNIDIKLIRLYTVKTVHETLHSCSAQPADVHEGIPLLSKI
jgi:hypothetical protein